MKDLCVRVSFPLFPKRFLEHKNTFLHTYNFKFSPVYGIYEVTPKINSTGLVPIQLTILNFGHKNSRHLRFRASKDAGYQHSKKQRVLNEKLISTQLCMFKWTCFNRIIDMDVICNGPFIYHLSLEKVNESRRRSLVLTCWGRQHHRMFTLVTDLRHKGAFHQNPRFPWDGHLDFYVCFAGRIPDILQCPYERHLSFFGCHFETWISKIPMSQKYFYDN